MAGIEMIGIIFSKQKAFTLIELMITLVVMGIVIGMAIPKFNTLILNNKSVAVGEDFVGALNLARSMAVKKGGRASLCATIDGLKCSDNPESWAKGFMAIEDFATSDNAAAPVLVGPDFPQGNILRVWGAQGQDIQTRIQVSQGGSPATFIRFTALGTLARVVPNAVDAEQINVRMVGCTGNSARKIKVGWAGVIGVTNDVCP